MSLIIILHFSPPALETLIFLSLFISLIWTFHTSEIMQYVSFHVWFLSQSIMFRRSSILQHVSVFSFYCLIVLHYIDITHFVYSFTSYWAFGLFHLLVLVDSTSINIYICVDMFSFPLGRNLGVKLLDYGNSIFHILRNCHTIFLESGCTIL